MGAFSILTTTLAAAPESPFPPSTALVRQQFFPITFDRAAWAAFSGSLLAARTGPKPHSGARPLTFLITKTQL